MSIELPTCERCGCCEITTIHGGVTSPPDRCLGHCEPDGTHDDMADAYTTQATLLATRVDRLEHVLRRLLYRSVADGDVCADLECRSGASRLDICDAMMVLGLGDHYDTKKFLAAETARSRAAGH